MQTPEQRLFAQSMIQRVSDAIYPFRIPGVDEEKVPPIEKQYEDFLSGKRKMLTNLSSIERKRAIIFLESDQFDAFASIAGYDSHFVNKTFQFVQNCLTLRKKLYKEKMLQPGGLVKHFKAKNFQAKKYIRLTEYSNLGDFWKIGRPFTLTQSKKSA